MSGQQEIRAEQGNGAAGNGQEQGTQTGRDERGRFSKGNPGGPGNPFTRQVAENRKAMLEAMSQRLQNVVNKLLEKAEDGDLGAIKLVLAYGVGRPDKAENPDRMDVEEVKLFREEACGPEEVGIPLKTMPAALNCQILRTAVPAMAEALAQQTVEGLAEMDRRDAERAQEREEELKEIEKEEAEEEAMTDEEWAEKQRARVAALPTIEEIMSWSRAGKGQEISGMGGIDPTGTPDRKRNETGKPSAQ